MKSKTARITLLSGLTLAAFVGTTNVLAEDAAASQAPSTAANTAVNSSSAGTAPAATSQQAQSPSVTVTKTETVGNTTVTTSDVASQELEDAKAAAQNANLTVTETPAVEQPSVAAADADNKAQAQKINQAVADYDKAKTQYAQEQNQYQQDLASYNAQKSEYDAKKQAYDDYQQQVSSGQGAGRVERAQGLIFENEPKATVTIQGVTDYLDKAARAAHQTDDILEQFNTDKYADSEFTLNNPYDPNEDTWFKMAVGDTIAVTYENIVNSSYNKQKISKIVTTYKLNSSTNNDGTAIVELFHDPTKTIFIGAQTSNAGRNDKISVTMQITFYDENGNAIDLSDNRSIMSLSSLNHWTADYGDHVEKVELGNNEFIQIPGSSISLHGNEIYSINDNQYKDNGATFDGDGDDGWDAVNADGDPRSATAYYGAGAMTYKGEPFTFTVGGNDQGLPTSIWFATNSTVAVPENPGEEPQKPSEPKLEKPTVVWHKNFVVETQGIPPEVPEDPESPTPEPPMPPSPQTPQPPTPPRAERPSVMVSAKSRQFRQARKDETRVRERSYQPTLPQTGDDQHKGLSAIGLVSAAFAAATLLVAKKREE
ncbi:GbpC/Spa domain-containing protein [Streptococcus caviae]|uniref:GbpC/Spa domain-containing protein n=1 Tax=Streptococcus sp. 'caviae' TaxID=1915004 RepID=UPI00094BBD69|nr:GbpC/Spa domain-containing protein [Streptococcus sp. 'caviae']OLN82977.1 glucan-binding protein [Streptococcus sp. 'caviae']